RAGAETTVDRELVLGEEDGQRLIKIELEVGEIERIGLNDSHADELVHEIADDRITARNIIVEFLARFARNAPKDDEHRLLGRSRGADSFSQIIVNPVL